MTVKMKSFHGIASIKLMCLQSVKYKRIYYNSEKALAKTLG